MNFPESSENKKLIERLEKSVQDGRISHAYLFEASPNTDTMAFAKAFVKGILCPAELSPDGRGENCGRCELCSKIDHDNHEDILYIAKDGNSIKDEAIIAMQEHLKVKPVMDRNVTVIFDSGSMTPRAQNRLLKTLEEPLGNAVMILFAENMENLVDTIRSRCVKYRINSGTGKSSRKASNLRAKAADIVDMSLRGEPYYKIRSLIPMGKLSNEEAIKLLDEMELVYRNIIIDNSSEEVPLYDFDRLYDGIYTVEHTKNEIRSNVSVKYALGNLILKLDR